MKRTIQGYHLDEQQDWVAELDCFHGQHIRHKPPFTNRPWVATEQGRNGMLGETLNCVRCDRLELPEGLESYRATPRFDESSIPHGLLKEHSTKQGTWGIIHVLRGELIYQVFEPEVREFGLNPGSKGIVAPAMAHCVRANGKVIFYVEFFTKRMS